MLKRIALSAKPKDKSGSAGTCTVCRMHLRHVRVSAKLHSSSSPRTQNGHEKSRQNCNIFVLKKSLFGAMGDGSEAVTRLMEMLRMRATHKRAYQSSAKADLQPQPLICAAREETEVSRPLHAENW